MTAYIVRRLLYAVFTFLGITVVTFTLIHAVPGDPIDFLASSSMRNLATPQQVAALRHEYHLDQPLAVQYLYWLRGVVTLDFGRSIARPPPVVDRILEKDAAHLRPEHHRVPSRGTDRHTGRTLERDAVGTPARARLGRLFLSALLAPDVLGRAPADAVARRPPRPAAAVRR